MRRFPTPHRTPKPRGFNATAMQIRRAWMMHYRQAFPQDRSYADCSGQLIHELGYEKARAFILTQPNTTDETAVPSLAQLHAHYDALWDAQTKLDMMKTDAEQFLANMAGFELLNQAMEHTHMLIIQASRESVESR